MALPRISLMISDVELFPTCLLALHVFRELSIRVLRPLFNQVFGVCFISLLLSCLSSSCILDVNSLRDGRSAVIVPRSAGAFRLGWSLPPLCGSSSVGCTPLVHFCPRRLCFWHQIQEIITRGSGVKFFAFFCSWHFTVSSLSFEPFTHVELVLCVL